MRKLLAIPAVFFACLSLGVMFTNHVHMSQLQPPDPAIRVYAELQPPDPVIINSGSFVL